MTPFGDAGDGVASVASVTPGAPAQAPTGLTAQSGDGQVDLSWTAPLDTGGMQINSYVIEESTDATNWTLASSVDGSTHDVNLQGLKNFTNYTFRVSAVTNFGKGLSAVLATDVSALPSAPLALHLVNSASQTVTIGWSLPTGSTADSVSGFKVEQSLDGTKWIAVSSLSASALTATLVGLTNGTTYEIRVTPIAGTGVGASSVILATPGSVPGTISGLSTTAGDKKVTLSFTAPVDNGGFNIDNYSVDIANSSSGPWTVALANSGSSITHIDITNLKDGVTYFFRISAVNQIGTSPTSRVVSGTPQSIAAAPVVQSFVLAPTSATITWVPPAGLTSKLIQQYLVETSPDGTLWSAVKTLPLTARVYTVTRLKTPLLVRVRAITAIGSGVPTLGIRVPGTTSGGTVVTTTPPPTGKLGPSAKPTPTPKATPTTKPIVGKSTTFKSTTGKATTSGTPPTSGNNATNP